MKSIKKSTNRPLKKALLILIGVVFVVSVYGLTAYAIKLWPFTSSPNQTSQSNSSKDTAEDQESNSDNQSIPKTPDNTTTNVKNDTPSASANQSSGMVTITGSKQDNGFLRVRAFIPSVESSGTCTLTLTKGSSKLTFSTGIQPGPSTSTCQGFDISISEENITPGTWTVLVNVAAGSTNASASQEVTIK